LVVKDPSMTGHDPWVLNPGSPASSATRGTDRTNNLEQVLVDSPAAGTWAISVHGYDVPLAPQYYSLVSELLAFENVYLPLVLKDYSAATVNNPPYVPSAPSPADGAIDQDADVDLSWTGGDPDGDGVTYDVYVADGDVSAPDVLACYDLTTATCEPGTLGSSRQYSWRVVATDEHGAKSVSPVWDLTTEAGPGQVLSGTVTEDGTPLQGTDLLLRLFDGSGWSTYDTATTGLGGAYQFTSLPSLGAGQFMYVRWQNTGSNNARLWSWQCGPIWPTTTDPAAFQCDFDVDNVVLTGPPSGAVTLPVTFTWQLRPFPSDDYQVDIIDPTDAIPWWSSPPLGYVGEYTLTSLCGGCEFGVAYNWWVWVRGDNGAGESYYVGSITFTSPTPREPFTAVPSAHPRNWRDGAMSGELRSLAMWRGR
jgi:hypothetical protein